MREFILCLDDTEWELLRLRRGFCRALANATSSKHCFRQLHFTIAVTNWRRAVIRCRCLLGGQQLADGGLESLMRCIKNAGRRAEIPFWWIPRRAFAVGGSATPGSVSIFCARMGSAASALHRIGDAAGKQVPDK